MDIKKTISPWFVLLTATYAFFLEGFIMKALGVLLPDMKEQFRSATWTIGTCIGMIEAFGYVLGLSATFLERKFGARMCIMMSGLTASAGLLVCSSGTNIYVLFIGMTMTGSLMLQCNIAMGILPRYFDRLYSVAVNISIMGTSVAILITPLIIQELDNMYGWRGTLLIMTGVLFQSVLFGTLVKNSKEYEDKSLTIQENNENRRDTFCTFCNQLDVRLLTNPAIIACVIIPAFVEGFVWTGWLVHIVSYVVSTGASLKQASIVSSCGGVGLMLTRIVAPFMDEVISYRKLQYTASLLMAVPLLMTAWFNTVQAFCITSFVFCMGKAMVGSEIYIAIRDICNRDQYIGAISWHHFSYGIATVFGAGITGLIYDISGSYILPFILLVAVSMIISLALAIENMWIKSH